MNAHYFNTLTFVQNPILAKLCFTLIKSELAPKRKVDFLDKKWSFESDLYTLEIKDNISILGTTLDFFTIIVQIIRTFSLSSFTAIFATTIRTATTLPQL